MATQRLVAADTLMLLAAKTGLTQDQVKSVLQAQAEIAYQYVRNGGYPIAGLGFLNMAERPARKMVMQFGPRKGETVEVPASQKLNFRLSSLVSRMVRGGSQPLPDLFRVPPPLICSAAGELLANDAPYIGDLGARLTLATKSTPVVLHVYRLPDLRLTSGRIVASDPMIGSAEPFTRRVPPGEYALALAIAQLGSDQRVAFAMLRFSFNRVARWEIAVTEPTGGAESANRSRLAYGVDSGTGSFADASAMEVVAIMDHAAEVTFFDLIGDQLKTNYQSTRNWLHVETERGSIAVFSSGYGDGSYASFFGFDDEDRVVALITDFGIVDWDKPDSDQESPFSTGPVRFR